MPRSRAARAALWVAGALAALYLLFGAVAAHLLSRPQRVLGEVTPADAAMPYRAVVFPAAEDSVAIAAWWIPRPGSRAAVVMAHGINNSKGSEFGGRWATDVARGLWDQGLSVLMIDLRGHGESGEGRLAFGLREQRDVRGAAAWLLARGVEPGRIGALGISMGAAAAYGAAARTPAIGAVASDAAFADVGPVVRRAWPVVSGLPAWLWPPTRWMGFLVAGYDFAGARPVEQIPLLSGRPVLLIHGGADRLVPPVNARVLQSAHGGPSELWIVPGADHARSYAAAPDAYVRRLGDFFARSLRVDDAPGSPAKGRGGVPRSDS